jgi:hypothetical protein
MIEAQERLIAAYRDGAERHRRQAALLQRKRWGFADGSDLLIAAHLAGAVSFDRKADELSELWRQEAAE